MFQGLWNGIFRAPLLAVILIGATLAPALAQSALDLLESYVGKWQGQSALVGGAEPEPFKCRLTVSKGNQSKINYAGRCTLVSMNLSVNGTILFDEKARRYQAVMSSNAGFKGNAIGVQQGDSISFDLNENQVDRGGNNIRIGSNIILVGDMIRVKFEVEFNNSGNVLTADVPFSR